MRRRSAVAAAVAALLAAPFLLVGLGRVAFDDPGEGMHAEIARELTLSHDPFALTLNGVRYVDKPPLLYALMAAAFALGGQDEGHARLVSALAALAAIAVTAWLGARLLGVASGVLAGLALLSCAGFFAYGRYVRPETLFLAALAAGFALSLVGLAEGRRGLVIGGLAAFGLAGLAKDALGVLGPPLVIGAALMLCGRLRPISRWLPIPGVVLWVVLGFGWWILFELRTPGFTWYTVIDNHVLNVARARWFPDEDVPLPVLQFLAVAAAGAVPWILPALAELGRLARPSMWRDPEQMPWLALGLWSVGLIGLVVLSPFRLPHYGLPAYPALALLAARRWHTGKGRGLVVVHVVLFAALGLACGAAWMSDGVGFMGDVMGAADVATRKSVAAGQASEMPPWETIRPLLGRTALVLLLGAVVVAVIAVIPAVARRRRAWASWAVAVTVLALLPCVATGLALVSAHRAVRALARQVGRDAGSADLIVHEGPIENSGGLEWYAGRRPVIVDGRRSVLGFGATRAEASSVFWDADRLAAEWRGASRIWALTSRAPDRSLLARLPGTRLVAVSGGRWLYVNH